MSDDDLVTITVRRKDIEDAIGDIWTSHGEYCLSSDRCDCHAIAERLGAALAEAAPEAVTE